MTRSEATPPAIPKRILGALLARSDAPELLDELDDLFRHRCVVESEPAARRWYWRQIPSVLWRFGLNTTRRAKASNVSFLRQDVVYALRTFGRAPGFTALVVGTLTLGIGAATAIWSVAYPVVLSPLGYVEEEQIVRVWPERYFTQEQLELYRDRTRSLSSFSGMVTTGFTLTGEGEPALVRGVVVSPGHFEVFGIEPSRGRVLEPRDSLPGSEPVVVVSHDFWLSRLGGRADVLGSRVELGGMEGARRTVVGVAPPGFRPLGSPNDVWVPAAFDRESEAYRDMANMRVVARMRPGGSIHETRAELQAIAASLEPPPYYLSEVSTYTVLPFRDALLGDVRPTLFVLLGAVTLVLLLCCTNVANLLLARNRSREKETAVRRALGASGARLARQWMTESLVLAMTGGVLGVALVALASPAITSLVPASFPRASDVRPDLGLAVMGFGLSLAAALVFGAIPALRASRAEDLASRGTTLIASRARWNQSLVVMEIALSLALVSACGLLVKSFLRLSRVEAGFSALNVVSIRLSPSTLRYADESSRKAYFRSALETVAALPNVTSAGAIQLLPMTPSFMGVGFSPSGAPVPDGESPPTVSYRVVTPGYRSTLGIPLLSGRDLSRDDLAGRQSVGLVNESLAERLVPPGDVVGRELRFEDGSPWFTIVGVIGDVHQQRLDRAPIPEAYVPHEQDAWPSAMYVVAQVEGNFTRVAPVLRAAVWSVDEDVPLSEIRPMDAVVRASMTTERLRTLLFASFASLAFLLSAIGVYGVVSYTVSQRTREIGVRMTFGASGAQVVAETLTRTLKPVGYGLALGLLLALATTRSLSTLLFDVDTSDPVVYGLALLSLAIVALVACFVPARRASNVDPLTSLRIDA